MPEKLLGLTDTNTTYSEATQSKSGLMSASDKKKLDTVSTGATSGEIKLLYTNPNPYSATSGFTVNLSLSEYKVLLIDFINQVGSAHVANGQWFPIGASCMAYGSAYNSEAVLRRPVTTSISGVVFGNGSHGNGVYDSIFLVPWHIYGLK